jgi:HPt (histidine-containing phosphotransfer) domain-containing protein
VWLEPSAGLLAAGLAEALVRRGARLLRPAQGPLHAHLLLGDGPLPAAREGWLGLARAQGAPAVVVGADWDAPGRAEEAAREGLLLLPPDAPAERWAPLVESLLPSWAEARALDAELAVLREAYRAGLPGKLEALADAVRAALAAPHDAEVRRAACRLAHGLRGGAGSYGYGAVSAVAGRLELALAEPEDGRAGAPLVRPELEAALGQAEAAGRTAAASAPAAAGAAPLARVLVCGVGPGSGAGRALLALGLPLEVVLAADAGEAQRQARAARFDAALLVGVGAEAEQALRAAGVARVARGEAGDAEGLALRVRQLAVFAHRG